MATLELRGLAKTFEGSTPAVHPLDLGVHDGELLVLVGPSGCGKSTILRMVAGLERPTAGEVLLGGTPVTHLPPQARNVAMVFQNYALYPHKSVRGNLAFPLRMARRPRREIATRVERVARLLGLEELLDRKPAALSGGQRQRVAMGRAIVRDPQAFLMDEPLSNLDAKLRTEIRGEISRLQTELGVTTVYVTHDQVEAMTLGQRIAVLFDGRLAQVGPSATLYDRPGSVWVAGFLGSPPMNLLEARLASREGTPVLVLGERALPVPPEHVPAAAREHETLLVGIRPEAWTPEDAPGSLDLVVRKAEPLGHETILHVGAPGPVVVARPDGRTIDRVPIADAQVAARVPPRSARAVGDVVSLAVDPSRIRWFAPSGESLESA